MIERPSSDQGSASHRCDRVILFGMILYSLPTVGVLLQGVLYLTTPRFMPYHADALSVDWDELSLSYKGFILGVIRSMGAGSFCVALALLIILYIPFRRRENWTYWAVPLIGTTFSLLTAHAAYTIDRQTPASTPWLATCALALVYVLTAVSLRLSRFTTPHRGAS